MIPQLETKRLVLRAPVRADFAAFCDMWDRPEVLAHTFKEKRGPEALHRSFLINAGSWLIDGLGMWVLAPRETPERLIGLAGFFMGNRGHGTDVDSAPEAGWVLLPEHHGQGLMGEAMTEAHRWFDRQGHPLLHCQIELGHAPSERLALRLGYRPLREVEEDGDRLMIYRRVTETA